MKTMNDALITATYQKMLLANPDKSATSIIKHFHGTAYAMRRQDALEIIKGLKRTNAEVMGSPAMEGMGFMERMDKSDLFEHKGPGFRAKMQKDALKVGRREALATSRRGKRTGKKAGTVKDMRDRMFKNVDAEQDYVEFYG